VTNYGREATEALAEELAAAKAADSLASVTVVVPSNTVGLSARRLLGGRPSTPDGSRGGIANVGFVTPFRLAELLGRRRSAEAGLAPLTNPVLAAAIREELAANPGFFAPVAGHVATETALVRCYAELSRARHETLDRIATVGSSRAFAVVDLFRRVRSRLEGYADEDVLVRCALGSVEHDRHLLDELGVVVVHLPQPCSPALADLLRAVLDRVPSRVVVGLTGATDADGPVRDLCGRLEVALGPTSPPAPSGATEILRVADPDEEVRAAVRRVVAAAESGVPLDRMGIFFPASGSYARMVHEHLVIAGIPHNGPPVRRLAGSVTGRTLLRLLDLVDGDLRRDEVVALVAGAPVRDATGHRAPGHHWDLLSRRAGVVRGPDEWAERLAAFSSEQRARAVEQEAEGRSEGAVRATRREAEEAEALARFVTDLAAALDPDGIPHGWSGRARWARALLAQVLGDEQVRARWPSPEADAADRVEVILERLAVLDAIEPDPSFDVFRRAVGVELEAPTARIGRFGEGVVCGSLGLGLGLDLDVVIALGMAEGTCPSPRREDSLLADADRELAVDGELALRTRDVHDQHRELLATIAAGRAERLLLSARGDHRTGRGRSPSRWLLDAASELRGGERVFTSTLGELGAEHGLTEVASFVAGTREATVHASIGDRDFARLLAWCERGGSVEGHPIASDAALAAGLAVQAARASSELTRWDGNLGGCGVPAPASGEVVSATRLEGWATCPFRYFLGSVLRLGAIEAPEQIAELSSLDRGRLVHEVLERFLAPIVARPVAQRLAPDERWPDAERDRLVQLADQVCAEYEAEGLTGKPLLWRIQREELVADLLGFLDADDGYRAMAGAVPEQVEMAFGFDDRAPVVITLPDGRELAFRGRADRVDRLADGSLRVLDYKTAKADRYKGLDVDPVLAGTCLQLPLYAAAARAQLGGDGAPGAGVTASAEYWFVTGKGGYTRLGYEVDGAVQQRFVEVLGEIAAGIEEGGFAATPGEHNSYFGTADNCRFCDFDALCPVDRVAFAEAKSGAPELARIEALVAQDTGVAPDREQRR